MNKSSFNNPQFIKTALEPAHYPRLLSPRGTSYPEIAVAGRSNVGKSSLLNHLFNRKSLVKTSSVPGKTQALNFFTVDDTLGIVDLPGYGYAKVPFHVKRQWGPMVQAYLNNREQLKVVLFLIDIRRIPNDEDKLFVEWVANRSKAMILVLTKVDKVKTQEKKRMTTRILDELQCANIHYIHYSTKKNIGRKELIGMINDALVDELMEE
ncbi:YihA family ribosome biogenesis GTP-binding protein [Simkania negevensis]|uniref:Probable GTP-binding protein EngB n=1 Tax=Simkania negevensis TaxID=83561 RepID=A0ABS3ASQ1_9BACT|nr:YihA family ribosome biogenesis GTP-binding protein [Simkania negevensis]